MSSLESDVIKQNRECRQSTNLPRRQRFRQAFTLIELLVVVAVIAILVALILPSVQQAREAARQTACRNNLKQMGISLHSYHDTFGSLPSGYISSLGAVEDDKGWGWGAMILPFIEQNALYGSLRSRELSLTQVAYDYRNIDILQTPLSLYTCPSDQGGRLCDEVRSIVIPGSVAVLWPESRRGQSASTAPASRHIPPPPPKPEPPKPPPPPPPIRLRIGRSNYVGVFGSQWDSRRDNWSPTDFGGNGLFGRNSLVRLSLITDGTSNTLAIGERSTENFAATWAGVDASGGCAMADNQSVLGTAFYPLNQKPVSEYVDCEGTGSANFSSVHPGGAFFLLADGSVRFLAETIDSRPTTGVRPTGLYQKLAHRSDGEIIEEF